MLKLRNAGKPLGEYVDGKFYRGILTGFNAAFIIDRATRDRLISEDPNCAEILKAILNLKKRDPDADVSVLEIEINQIVYSLYNLTPDEIAIVEES